MRKLLHLIALLFTRYRNISPVARELRLTAWQKRFFM